MTIKDLGSFPVEGEKARESAEFYVINNESALKVISGKKSPVMLNFYTSNDVVNLGEMLIPTGGVGPRQTEFDTHPGDAVFYIKQGPLTFFLPDIGETYHVENGDFMFIPENNRYKIINYTGKLAKAIFIVAPQL